VQNPHSDVNVWGQLPAGAGCEQREIQSHLHEMYGVEISPTLVSEVTIAVLRRRTAGSSLVKVLRKQSRANAGTEATLYRVLSLA